MLASCATDLGWALVQQGQEKEGLQELQRGVTATRATGSGLLTRGFVLLAETYGKIGQVEEGLATIAEAIAVMEKTGERIYEAELYRIKGELLLMQARQLKNRVIGGLQD